MPCGQSVLFLCYLSQQYSQNVVFVPIVSVLRSIVVNGKYPKGGGVYRIGCPDSIKGLSLCPWRLERSERFKCHPNLQTPVSDFRPLTSDLRCVLCVLSEAGGSNVTPTSRLRLPTSDLRPPTSDFRPLASDQGYYDTWISSINVPKPTA